MEKQFEQKQGFFCVFFCFLIFPLVLQTAQAVGSVVVPFSFPGVSLSFLTGSTQPWLPMPRGGSAFTQCFAPHPWAQPDSFSPGFLQAVLPPQAEAFPSGPAELPRLTLWCL